MSVNIPNEWFCPITREIMTDPVLCKDGRCYERSAIEKWLVSNDTSPLNRRIKLSSSELIPDYCLRNTIETLMSSELFKNSILNQKTSISSGFSDKNPDKISMNYSINDNLVKLSLTAPIYPSVGRVPLSLICVIDVSGSMNEVVTVGNESDGFTRLDIVKHAVHTIISSLDDCDQLSLITFSTSAITILEPEFMNNIGKQSAKYALDNTVPGGETNLWGGLQMANLTINKMNPDSNKSIVVLTDGQSNKDPPRGILYEYKKQFPSIPINTFGFGYSINSELLHYIAEYSGGIFCFIPDGTFVGTVFINFLAILLSSCKDHITLTISDTSNIKEIHGCQSVLSENEGEIKVIIGSIMYGQPRNIIIELKEESRDGNPGPLFKISGSDENQELIVQTQSVPTPPNFFIADHYRILFSEVLINTIKKLTISERYNCIIEFLDKLLNDNSVLSNPVISNMIRDIRSSEPDEGQVLTAVSRKDYYEKWGSHYLYSLSMAHKNQMCLNFKDPGIQIYGSNLFIDFQTKIEKIFNELPVPKPSQPYLKNTSRHVLSMSSYNSQANPCFDGNGDVITQNGPMKVKDLRKGIVLSNGATIKCILKTKIFKEIEIVNINDVLITPWHPVVHYGTWKFPSQIFSIETKFVDYIYSILLDRKQETIKVNDLEIACLAHEMTGPVIYHKYYGTERVVEDLKKMRGFENGLVILTDYKITTDNKGIVNGIIQY